ncbi:MAG: type II secretion system F family protein [Phycisphaerales bacterium JB038]
MQTFSYQALTAGVDRGGELHRGEISAETAEDARALLRQVGLTVLGIKAVTSEAGSGFLADLRARRQRSRRTSRKSELLDSLAVLLDAGIPLAESLTVLAGSAREHRSAEHRLLVGVRDAVRSGVSFADSLTSQPRWFDGAEVAMIRSGEHSGELSTVLHLLSDRHRRHDELTGKLVAALTYPSIVMLAGVGVVLFLSTQTLPNLVEVLRGGGIAPPTLTLGVIWLGTVILRSWWLPLVIATAGLLLSQIAKRRAATQDDLRSARLTRWLPSTARSLVLARTMEGLAELTRAGVPLVESLRVLAPTLSGPGSSHMRAVLNCTVTKLEHGASFASALADHNWIDSECHKLLAVGEESGEMESALTRLADRYQRRARRQIERLLAVLEPTVILTLAVLVGLVVMAAVLPMLRLQQLL